MPRHSTMLALGTEAPKFALPDTVGTTRKLAEFAASPLLLVAFICNHCPYVKHILDGFVQFAHEYGPKGVAVVAISSNDVESHPQKARAALGQVAKDPVFASRLFSPRPTPSPRRISPFVLLSSVSLIAGGRLFIAANSTAAVR